MYPYPRYPYLTYQPPPTNATNMALMPSEGLEAILKVIQQPAEPPQPQPITHVIREPKNYQRGRGFRRGSYRGGYQGRGRRSTDNSQRDLTLIVEPINPPTTPINMGPLSAEDPTFLGLAAEEPIEMAREVPIKDVMMNSNE